MAPLPPPPPKKKHNKQNKQIYRGSQGAGSSGTGTPSSAGKAVNIPIYAAQAAAAAAAAEAYVEENAYPEARAPFADGDPNNVGAGADAAGGGCHLQDEKSESEAEGETRACCVVEKTGYGGARERAAVPARIASWAPSGYSQSFSQPDLSPVAEIDCTGLSESDITSEASSVSITCSNGTFLSTACITTYYICVYVYIYTYKIYFAGP